MRKLAPLLLLLWCGGLGFSAAPQSRRPVAGKASSPSKTTGTSKKKTVSKKRSSRRTSRRRRRIPSWRRGQQEPTPQRYEEIQQALIERGYLEGPATGKWAPESVDALKRFQSEQKLEATGRLNALSLIALGLGPKRDSTIRKGQLVTAAPKALQ